MLEVVFSDSAAGTMAVAIGHKGFLGGATSVIISDGTVSKEEIETKVEDTTKSIAEKLRNVSITGKKKKQIKEENGKDNKGAE